MQYKYKRLICHLGIPSFLRPTSNDQPLTDRTLMFNGQGIMHMDGQMYG